MFNVYFNRLNPSDNDWKDRSKIFQRIRLKFKGQYVRNKIGLIMNLIFIKIHYCVIIYVVNFFHLNSILFVSDPCLLYQSPCSLRRNTCFLRQYIFFGFHCTGNVCGRVLVVRLRSVANYGMHTMCGREGGGGHRCELPGN